MFNEWVSEWVFNVLHQFWTIPDTNKSLVIVLRLEEQWVYKVCDWRWFHWIRIKENLPHIHLAFWTCRRARHLALVMFTSLPATLPLIKAACHQKAEPYQLHTLFSISMVMECWLDESLPHPGGRYHHPRLGASWGSRWWPDKLGASKVILG